MRLVSSTKRDAGFIFFTKFLEWYQQNNVWYSRTIIICKYYLYDISCLYLFVDAVHSASFALVWHLCRCWASLSSNVLSFFILFLRLEDLFEKVRRIRKPTKNWHIQIAAFIKSRWGIKETLDLWSDLPVTTGAKLWEYNIMKYERMYPYVGVSVYLHIYTLSTPSHMGQ